jgi:hypothetical protein
MCDHCAVVDLQHERRRRAATRASPSSTELRAWRCRWARGMAAAAGSSSTPSSERPLREKQALSCNYLHGKEPYLHGKGFAVRPRTAKIARQCYRRQRLLCRVTRQRCTAKALPCDAARQRSLLCRVPNMFYLKKGPKLAGLGIEPRTQSRESVQPCH